jgi:hypothetical protein
VAAAPSAVVVTAVSQATVPHVEQGARVVVARGDDAWDARELGQQRHRQRALVVGGEHDGLGVRVAGQPVHEPGDQVRLEPRGGHAVPGRVELDDVGDTGQHGRGLGAPG